MEKKLDVSPFTVAPRRKREETQPDVGDLIAPSQENDAGLSVSPNAEHPDPAPMRPARKSLPVVPAEERRAKAEKRALEQKATRRRLADLKQQARREAKFPINVHLDYDLKARLKEASLKTGVSIQKIAETAIQNFLLDEGF